MARTPTSARERAPGVTARSPVASRVAVLKLHDVAQALPAILDAAVTEKLSLSAALERLLDIEVEATEARRLAGRLRFACLPTPSTEDGFDYDAATGIDRSPITELGPAATCRPRPTSS